MICGGHVEIGQVGKLLCLNAEPAEYDWDWDLFNLATTFKYTTKLLFHFHGKFSKPPSHFYGNSMVHFDLMQTSSLIKSSMATF